MTVLKGTNQLSGYQEGQQDVVVVAEPISNTVLINAASEKFETILRIVSQLDIMPPQVAVDVLVGEVDLSDNDEFGVEIGLQTPIIFNRSLFGDPGNAVTYTATGNANHRRLPAAVRVADGPGPVAAGIPVQRSRRLRRQQCELQADGRRLPGPDAAWASAGCRRPAASAASSSPPRATPSTCWSEP